MEDILKKLCFANGVSGNEEVKEALISLLPKSVEYKEDNLGNLIVEKRSIKKSKNKILLCTNMDEVGFIVKSIEEDGCLRFLIFGNVNLKGLIENQIEFENGVLGVVGCKPVHLQEKDEEKNLKVEDMFIDVGVKTKAEAEKLVKPGDLATFRRNFSKFGTNKVKSKALESRVGCAILIDLLNNDFEHNVTCVFAAQGKFKLRGIETTTNSIQPDIVIFINSEDISNLDDTKFKRGAIINLMNGKVPHDEFLTNLIIETAKKNEIDHEVIVNCSKDSQIVQTNNGFTTASTSIPCKYCNFSCCNASLEDIFKAATLTKKIFLRLCEI